MLRFKSLTINNFGPFKGEQTIDFTDKDGVTIVWGNNGCGKTTILNIIKFLFFGYYKDRMGKDVDLIKLPNEEGTKKGEWAFGAILKMDIDGVPNELSREYVLRQGINEPRKNDDFVRKLFLNQNGDIFSNDTVERILQSLMPEDVSRFFFFDGELLQQYEELLVQGAQTDAIKEGIERILGVPVLTKAAVDTETAMNDYRATQTRISKSNGRTAAKAKLIEENNAKKEELQKEKQRLTDERDNLWRQKAELQKQADDNDEINRLITRKNQLELNLQEKKRNRDEKQKQVKEYTKDAWKWLATPRIDAIIEEIDMELNGLQQKENVYQAQKTLIDDMRKAADEHHCSVCDQDVDDEHVRKLMDKIEEYMTNPNGLTEEESETLNRLRARKSTLAGLRKESRAEGLAVIENDVETLNAQIPHDEEEIKNLSSRIKEYGDENILKEGVGRITGELAKCESKIENDNNGIDGCQEEIDSLDANNASLYADLKKLATDEESALAERKADLCEQIHKIFEEGVGQYRDKLKKDVESDATELFERITNDSGYASLRINDNYGLDIMHESGEVVPLRSSGFEHVVALSLIGALHKNAPMQGPIVMDSPFGRLDPEHTDNIIKVLPEMSDQIVLLVYNGEINAQKAREILEENLRKEYQLVKETSFHTEIEPL